MSNPWPSSSLAGRIVSSWLLCLSLLCLTATATATATACQLVNADGTLRPHKVLVVLSKGVLPLFHNWLLFHEEVCGGSAEAVASLELVCLDHSLRRTLPAMLSVNCSTAYSSPDTAMAVNVTTSTGSTSGSSSRNFVWLRRMEVVVQLLAGGFDVIVSDVDALWLQSPYPDLNQRLASSALISSQGNFPSELSRPWGSTLCLGFLYAQAGHASLLHFLSLVLVHMRGEENKADDQTSVNLLLFDMDVRWHRPMEREGAAGRERVGEVEVFSMDRSIEGKASFGIALLSVRRYLRYCLPAAPRGLNSSIDFDVVTQAMRSALDDRVAHAVVAHCWLPTSSQLKPFYLNAFSLWKASNESILPNTLRTLSTKRISLVDCVFWEKLLVPLHPEGEEVNITERRMLFMKTRCKMLLFARKQPQVLDEQQRQRIRNTIKWPADAAGADNEVRRGFKFAVVKADPLVARVGEEEENPHSS
eukprot:gene10708-11886_t